MVPRGWVRDALRALSLPRSMPMFGVGCPGVHCALSFFFPCSIRVDREGVDVISLSSFSPRALCFLVQPRLRRQECDCKYSSDVITLGRNKNA
jgi:hypothetical protein